MMIGGGEVPSWVARVAAAAASLGLLVSCGTGGPQQSYSSGAGAADSLAANGRLAAGMELAWRLTLGQGINRDAAVGEAIYEQIAQTGDPGMLTLIGDRYVMGTGLDKDPEKGAAYLKQAAAKRFAPAQVELAFLYIAGVGVPKDYDAARNLAQAAAEEGSPDGAAALGMIYANGWGVPIDPGKANAWFGRAAAKKSGSAMVYLGEAYRDGKGVAVDKVVAYAWFTLAADNANPGFERQNAQRRRDELALLMFPGELAQGRRLAEAWKPGDDLAAKRGEIGGAAKAGQAEEDDVTLVGAPPEADPPGNSPAASQDAPAVEKVARYDVDVQSDGSRIVKSHTETQIESEAAVKSFAQHPIYFDSAFDSVDVTEAYTLKPDGRKMNVAPSAIYTQLIPGAPDLPMFDSQRQKVVVFPDVEAGDVLVLSTTVQSKPILPGFFSFNMVLDRTVLQRDLRLTITAPETMPLTTETHDIRFEKRHEGDKVIYAWRYANLHRMAENNIALDPVDRQPRMFASNFRDYDQFAKAYVALAGPKGVVTPDIQKLADEITAGISDRRKQAEAIYDWVSRHIRYVAVELGQGAVIPHEAAAILANRYGDCKDHSLLFSTLLKAKGIASEIVLINSGNSYSLAAPPTFGSLDHAITWLPEFSLYADTTAGVAPFGVLPFGEYGKPVVHATAAGPALRRTPLPPQEAAAITVKTTARLSGDGRLSGDSETTATGPFAVGIRETAISIQNTGAEQAAKYLLRAKGFDGTGSLAFTSPFEMAPNYSISGHFETNPHPEFLSGNSFPLPIGLAVGWLPGEELMGPLTFIDLRGNEPTPCFNGRETEDLSLEIPTGRHVRDLPKGIEISNKYLHYKSAWSVSGQIVTMHREFATTLDQPVCIGETRREAAQALNQIRGDYNSAIALDAH